MCNQGCSPARSMRRGKALNRRSELDERLDLTNAARENYNNLGGGWSENLVKW